MVRLMCELSLSEVVQHASYDKLVDSLRGELHLPSSVHLNLSRCSEPVPSTGFDGQSRLNNSVKWHDVSNETKSASNFLSHLFKECDLKVTFAVEIVKDDTKSEEIQTAGYVSRSESHDSVRSVASSVTSESPSAWFEAQRQNDRQLQHVDVEKCRIPISRSEHCLAVSTCPLVSERKTLLRGSLGCEHMHSESMPVLPDVTPSSTTTEPLRSDMFTSLQEHKAAKAKEKHVSFNQTASILNCRGVKQLHHHKVKVCIVGDQMVQNEGALDAVRELLRKLQDRYTSQITIVEKTLLLRTLDLVSLQFAKYPVLRESDIVFVIARSKNVVHFGDEVYRCIQECLEHRGYEGRVFLVCPELASSCTDTCGDFLLHPKGATEALFDNKRYPLFSKLEQAGCILGINRRAREEWNTQHLDAIMKGIARRLFTSPVG